MSPSPKRYLTSLLMTAAMAINPVAAHAGGMSHIGNMGMSHGEFPARTGPDCRQAGGGSGPIGPRPSVINTNIQVYKPVNISNNVNVYKPISIDNNINVYKPVTIDNNVNITNNFDLSKSINVNKPISITKNIDNSKSIEITNNIDNSKNIDASKSIEINKSIVINKGNSEAEATAIAAAVAEASATASVNVFGAANSNSSSAGSQFFGSSFALEVPAPSFGGDIGNISVEAVAQMPARQPCTLQEATVVKAIHALCISADKHEFPAAHMVPDTWINSAYEGEIARCIPGSHLKVIVGKVLRSSEGMAAGYSSGQSLECEAHEALRHYKTGALKCAPAVPVPDCTERTNLRKYGTGDMFFTYRAKVCLETHDEFAETDHSDVALHRSRTDEMPGSY